MRRSSCSSPRPTCAPGAARVFRNAEITPDVLLASACLPTMFQAVEIDGEAYWDGGYSGNPTITPLVRECEVARHDPRADQSGRAAGHAAHRRREILNRLNEVSFNAVLLKELRMIALLRQAADPGDGEGARWAGMRIHRIATDMMTELGASSKLNRRMGLPVHAARRGPPRGARRSSTRTATISASARRSISTSCWKESDAMGLLGILVALGAPHLARLSRLERAAARARRRADRRRLRRRAAARALDADLHGRRRAFRRAVLSAVSARRAVRQADGGQRLGHGHRAFHDREARAAPRHPGRRAGRRASSPMAASACSSPSSCSRRWRRHCSARPAFRAG